MNIAITRAADHLAKFPNARASTLAHLIAREAKIAQLAAEIEARIDRQIAASFRTFPINVKRLYLSGKL